MSGTIGPRRGAKCFAVLTLAAAAALASVPSAAGGATVRVRTVKANLNGPSGFTVDPSGDRIWYLERGTGEVRILDVDTGRTRRWFRIRGVDGSGERGALGIALHPGWPDRPFVYVYVTRRYRGNLRNQLVRIRDDAGRGARMRVLLSSHASSSPYHNGGRIMFGPDGKLYVVIGDGHAPRNSQDLTRNVRGKILRLDPDGTAARGNPFGKIWAYGFRNSFGFTFDPATGRLWETENGPACNDELNRVRAGRNYGWGPEATCEGSAPRNTNRSGPRPRLPRWYFPSPIGITGAAFCDGCGLPGLEGDLVFGNVVDGTIRSASLSDDRLDVTGVASVIDTAGVHSIEVGPEGRIYFSTASGIFRLAPA
jgi:glucose/arabinose dehydrogenase